MNKPLIILCHGTWAQNLVNDFRKSFGFTNKIEIVELSLECSKEIYLDNVNEVYKKYNDAVFICDLYGSTTFKTAMIMGIKHDNLVYAGLSLELLIKLSNLLEEGISDNDIKKMMLEDIPYATGEELVTKYYKKFGGNKNE